MLNHRGFQKYKTVWRKENKSGAMRIPAFRCWDRALVVKTPCGTSIKVDIPRRQDLGSVGVDAHTVCVQASCRGATQNGKGTRLGEWYWKNL